MSLSVDTSAVAPVAPALVPARVTPVAAIQGQSENAQLLVATLDAQRSREIGRVVDDSIAGAAQAREQRAARDAEQRQADARRARAEQFDREEQQSAEAVSGRYRAEQQALVARSDARREESRADAARADRRKAQSQEQGRAQGTAPTAAARGTRLDVVA